MTLNPLIVFQFCRVLSYVLSIICQNFGQFGGLTPTLTSRSWRYLRLTHFPHRDNQVRPFRSNVYGLSGRAPEIAPWRFMRSWSMSTDCLSFAIVDFVRHTRTGKRDPVGVSISQTTSLRAVCSGCSTDVPAQPPSRIVADMKMICVFIPPETP